jgi:hypothetical protein
MKNTFMIATLVILVLHAVIIILGYFNFLKVSNNISDRKIIKEFDQVESKLRLKLEQLERARRKIFDSVQSGFHFVDTRLASLLQNQTNSTAKINEKLISIRKNFQERKK